MSEEKWSGARSPENLKKLDETQQAIAGKSDAEARTEASADVEDVMRMLTARWADRGFTPEQIVWSIALMTINWRETFPEKSGGKEAFDKICRDAKAYYDANT